MYTVQTPGYVSGSIRVDVPSRGTLIKGFRFSPILAAGQTYANAFGKTGIGISYYFTPNELPVQQIDGDTVAVGQQGLRVPDTSSYRVSNGCNLLITSAPIGQQFLVTILEEDDEELLPDDAGVGAAQSGGNNPNLVGTIEQVVTPDYVPTAISDGATISGAKGIQWAFINGNAMADGGAILAWQYLLDEFLTPAWFRNPENDKPSFPLVGFVLGQQALTVGDPTGRLLYAPSTTAMNGAAGCVLIAKIQF